MCLLRSRSRTRTPTPLRNVQKPPSSVVAPAPGQPPAVDSRKQMTANRERKTSRGEAHTKLVAERNARKGPEWPAGEHSI